MAVTSLVNIAMTVILISIDLVIVFICFRDAFISFAYVQTSSEDLGLQGKPCSLIEE